MFLIDSVADMTGKRDRDSLEVTVASVLFELLGSRRLAFWRTLEQGGVRRLHLRAGLRTGQPVAVSAPGPISTTCLRSTRAPSSAPVSKAVRRCG